MTTASLLKEHLDGFEKRQADTAKLHKETFDKLTLISEELFEITRVVNGVLLPSHQKDMDRKRAYEVLNEDASKLSFWGKLILTLGGVIILFIGFFRFYIIK